MDIVSILLVFGDVVCYILINSLKYLNVLVWCFLIILNL